MQWRRARLAKAWLVLSSLFFYAWWNPFHLPLLLGSIWVNLRIGRQLMALAGQPAGRRLLALGIGTNLLLLGWFRYAHFVAANVVALTGAAIPMPEIALPLGISFFTFTQIAWLVDSWQGKVRDRDALDYLLFVIFFPHVIAGPILHHREMMSQFASRWTHALRASLVTRGLFVFSLGLFKKVVLADAFAGWADAGLDGGAPLDFVAAWTTSLAYTLQLYLDFSGYCDMALGAALMFNIRLPINFDSPYKALDVQDFWRRWHITLSRYLRDYVYIPLGGNRSGAMAVSANLMATFLIGGLWHGASWMFVAWGAWIAHRSLARAAATDPGAVRWLGERDVRLRSSRQAWGDLARLLDARGDDDDAAVADIAGGRDAGRTFTDAATDRPLAPSAATGIKAPSRPTRIRSPAALNPGRLLWVRDSFGSALLPYVTATFAEVVEVDRDAVSLEQLAEFVRRYEPDRVLVSVVERNARSPWFEAVPPASAQ